MAQVYLLKLYTLVELTPKFILLFTKYEKIIKIGLLDSKVRFFEI